MQSVTAGLVLGMAILSPASPASGQLQTVDDFRDLSAWSSMPSDGASLNIRSDEGAMRLDFSLQGGSYVIARRALPLTLPDNYAFSFRIRGDAPPNNLEFKLIDASGENVWWRNQRDFSFPGEWRTVTIRKRQIEFAWGPSSAALQKTAFLELAISAGSGGKGTLWIDDLVLTPLPAPHPYQKKPRLTATSSAAGHPASAAMDGNAATAWRSKSSDPEPSLTIDFLESREYGAMTVDWDSRQFAADYDVEISDDGLQWENAYRVRGGIGGSRSLYLPDRQSRFVRLKMMKNSGAIGAAIREITIEPPEAGSSLNAFFEMIAGKTAKKVSGPHGTQTGGSVPHGRGIYPRSLIGEQSYWTLVGVDGDTM